MCCATSTFPLIGLSAARRYVTLSNNTSYYILIQLNNCINFTVYIIVLTTANRPKRVDENFRDLWLIYPPILFYICSIYVLYMATENENTIPLLYMTSVRPHLEYANAIWGPFYKQDQQLVERIQR